MDRLYVYGSILLAGFLYWMNNKEAKEEELPNISLDNVKTMQDISLEERNRVKIRGVVRAPDIEVLQMPDSSSEYSVSMPGWLNGAIPQWLVELENGTKISTSGKKPIVGGYLSD